MTKFNHSSPYLPTQYVRLSDLRQHLTWLLSVIDAHKIRVRLTRHGKPVAALISDAEFQELRKAKDLALFGPVHPVTGKDMGPAWVRKTGWTPGMAFQWSEAGAVVLGPPSDTEMTGQAMVAGETEEMVSFPAAVARKKSRWWRLW